MKAAGIAKQSADYKSLLFFEGITLISGLLGGLLGGMKFDTLSLPPLTPPVYLFPIIWCILYLLMGFAAYFIYIADDIDSIRVLRLYLLQLLVNVLRPLFFFRFQWRLFAFFWTLFLIALVTLVMAGFKYIRKISFYCMIPYLGWLLFTAYLNLGFYIVNL